MNVNNSDSSISTSFGLRFSLLAVLGFLIGFSISGGVEANEFGITSLPINVQEKTKRVCLGEVKDNFLNIRICTFGEPDVYISPRSTSIATPPPGYRYCAYQALKDSGYPSSSAIWVDSALDNSGAATFHYDVPCGGGGISLGSIPNPASVAIGALIVYFTGDVSSAASLLKAATYESFRTALFTYGAVGANQLVSTIAGEAINPISYAEELCGVGDASNYVYGGVNLYYAKTTSACPTNLDPAHWTNFANQASAVPGNHTPEILSIVTNLLLSDEPCALNISPATQNVISTGGNFTAQLTATGECQWQLQTDSSWLQLNSATTGTGNSTIQYTAESNSFINTRTGNITIWDGPDMLKSISVSQAGATDTDGDGIPDSGDNCKLTTNTNQLDSDGDHYGNACDADLNNDCKTNSLDLGKFKSVYGLNPGTSALKAAADFNVDNRVNSLDLGLFNKLYGKAPGPSGLATCN